LEPDPDLLPFLVVHGGTVWKSLVAASLLGTLLFELRRRKRDGRTLRLLITLPLVGGLVCGALWGIGHWAGRRTTHVHWTDVSVGEVDPIAIMAATPLRATALSTLTTRLDADPRRDPTALRRLLALVELRQDCPAVVAILSRHLLYEDALETARRCGSRPDEFGALVMLGRYQEAMDIPDFEPGWPHATVAAIATGDWERAAAAASLVANVAATKAAYLGIPEPPRFSGYGGPGPSPEHAARFRGQLDDPQNTRCLAELFASVAGDEAARRRLAHLAAEPGVPELCVLAWVETLPEPDRRARLRELSVQWRSSYGGERAQRERLRPAIPELEGRHFGKSGSEDGAAIHRARAHHGVMMLLWAQGEPPPSAKWRVLAAVSQLVEGRTHDPWGWLAPWAADARHSRPEHAFDSPEHEDLDLLAMRAFETVRAVYRDDFDAARSSADAGVREAVDLGAALRRAVELRAGTLDPRETRDAGLPYEWQRPREGSEQGREIHVGDISPDACDATFSKAVLLALDGDAVPLAEVLQSCRVPWHHQGLLYAAMPGITRGREDLIRALTVQDAASEYANPPKLPFQVVDHAAMRRDLLRRAGQDDEAARWHAIVEGNLDVFTHRDRLVALLLWNLRTPR
jgi:hypothetical protein